MAFIPGGLTDEPDLDLDYGDEPLDPNADAPEVAAVIDFSKRTKPKHPSGDDWAAYFRELRMARMARGAFDAGGQTRVVKATRDYAANIPPAAARLVQRVDARGWEVRMQQTFVRVEDLLYVGTTDDHNQGDLRTPQHERVYWGVQAVLEAPAGRAAAFWATWVRADVPGRKPGNKLESAVYWDPISGVLPALNAGDFEEWLSAFAPKPEPKRKPKVVPLVEAEGVWIA